MKDKIKYIPFIGVLYSIVTNDKITHNPFYMTYHIYSMVFISLVLVKHLR